MIQKITISALIALFLNIPISIGANETIAESARASADACRAVTIPPYRHSMQTMEALRNYDTILVTGGAGFIGSCFIRNWLQKDLGKVINLDALTYAGRLSNLTDVEPMLPEQIYPN